MDASVYWVATREAEVHYLDAIISAYDGLANVRREFRLQDGKAYYKVYVGPGMEEEFHEILAALRHEGAVEDAVRDDGSSTQFEAVGGSEAVDEDGG
jgi:hypothetical protein